MRDCLLTVYGEGGRAIADRRVVIPPLPERAVLERLYRENMDASCRYAVAREDRRVRALYLAEDLLPEAAVRTTGRRGRAGRWVTTALQVGPPGVGRAFVGPDLFFRQVDLGPSEAWLAPVLMNFGADLDVREHVFATPAGTEKVYEWEFRDDRYYYRTLRGGRWALYGAGNTPTDRVDRVVDQEKPSSPEELLWLVGAMKLHG